MKKRIFRFLRREDGVTLVEVVASVILISVILISFFGIFMNAFKFNAINDENLQAYNLARDWKAKINNYSWNDIGDPTSGFIKATPYYIYETNVGEFHLKILISEEPERPVVDYYVPLRKVHIQILKSNQLISETYTYHEG